MPGLKSRALLAYLACNAGIPQSRDKLVGLLWAERFEVQARQSLRHALSELRKVLGPTVLRTDRGVVELDREFWSDVSQVETLLSGEPDGWRDAIALYQNDLLVDFSVRERPFMAWLATERVRLRDIVLGALDQVFVAPYWSLSPAERLKLAQWAVSLDPYREQAHRQLLCALVLLGRRNDAVMHYRQFERTLSAELGVSPESTTRAIFEDIRMGRCNATPHRACDADAGRLALYNRQRRTDIGQPSIAVLPFANLSNDCRQDFICYGITADIITELSRFQSLLVIACSSTSRVPSVDIAEVQRQFGVQYVVEGSIRKTDNRLRVTALLVEVMTQRHLWAECYDRDAQDILNLQDELARTIASTLAGRIAVSSAQWLRRKPVRRWEGHDYYLQGREFMSRNQAEEADQVLARAIELNAGYACSHAWRAIALTMKYLLDQRAETIDHALACAQQALALDDNDAWSHEAMGYVALRRRQFDQAGLHFDRAIGLNRNDINVAADRANWLLYVGRPQEALNNLDSAIQRDPYPPPWVWEIRALILFHLSRCDEAIAALRRLSISQGFAQGLFAAIYAESGRLDDAHRSMADFRATRPDSSVVSVARVEAYADPAMLSRFLNALHRAGLPEEV